MKYFRKNWGKLFITSAVLLFAGLFFCYRQISSYSAPYLFTSISRLPVCKAGLLLGSSKYLTSGKPSVLFQNRVNAAAYLYRAGKIRYIIASGDSNSRGYNEVTEMKNGLISQGIPDSAIIPDYEGFRTFQSIARCAGIFGQSTFTIISQRFHNERAIYISRHLGLTPVAFNADDVPGIQIRDDCREILARVKTLLEIHLLKPAATVTGEKVSLE